MGFIAVDPGAEDPVEAVFRETEGRGAERVVEACGFPITFLNAIKSTARFGEVVFMGNINGEFRITEKDFTHILRKELKIYGTWNSRITPKGKDDWSNVLRYMDRELIIKPLISHLVPLKDGVAIFEKMVKKEEFFNKVIFKL